ncbi:MAG: elongation factor P, partial [Treponema sp.]|nr:elongation factor P [Treponema sp.]MBP5452315.1 elongation factor P [Treponema sp.]
MISTNEIKVGSAFIFEGAPFIVQKKLGQKGGRQGITVLLRVKNIVTGSTQDLGIDAGEKFEEVELTEQTVRLSYLDGEEYVFQDQTTWDEVRLSKE